MARKDDDGKVRMELITPVISRRDWFAGMAMSGLLSDRTNWSSIEENSTFAVRAADALIAALDKEDK